MTPPINLKAFVAYAVTLILVMALDWLWLRVLARDFYQAQLAPILLTQPRLGAALLFYLVYALGILIFAVAPTLSGGQWGKAAVNGLLFGFFVYAVYDLTNLAVLKHWSPGLAALDIAWGSMMTAACAGAASVAASQISRP